MGHLLKKADFWALPRNGKRSLVRLTRKQRGEMAEAAFLAMAAHRADENGGYTFHAHGNTSCVYKASEIDVLVAYVVPVEAWYLFPVEEFRKYKAMKLFPASRRRRSKFEKFREAWWLVR